MRIILTVMIFNFLCLSAFSQTKEVVRKDSILRKMLRDECYCDVPGKCPTKNYYYTNHQYITNYSMSRLIRRDLTKITLDEEGLPVIGNYASMKISDDESKVTFNASFFNPKLFKKADSMEKEPIKAILSFNIKAGITDGVSDLFTNRNVNNEAGIKIKYSRLSKKTLYANDSAVDCATIKLYRERLLFEYEMIKKKLVYDSSEYESKKMEFWENIAKLKTDTAGYSKSYYLLLDSINKSPKDSSQKKIRDSLVRLKRMPLDSAALKFFELQTDYNEFQAKKPFYKEKEIIDSFYLRLLELETKNVKWHRFRIRWWDIDLSFDGKKYNLYSATRPLDSQLSKKPFTQWSLGFSYNFFSSKESQAFLKHGVFLKLSYLIGNDNSLSGKETKEIRTTVLTDTPNFRREVIEKVNAYTTAFETTFSHTVKTQFSKYLNKEKTQALSFYTNWVFNIAKLGKPLRFDGDPNITAGVGYLFGFLDKEKEKNVINLELFFNFNDLLNSEDDDSKFFSRHQLGIKFGVPFNSIFLNQK